MSDRLDARFLPRRALNTPLRNREAPCLNGRGLPTHGEAE